MAKRNTRRKKKGGVANNNKTEKNNGNSSNSDKPAASSSMFDFAKQVAFKVLTHAPPFMVIEKVLQIEEQIDKLGDAIKNNDTEQIKDILKEIVEKIIEKVKVIVLKIIVPLLRSSIKSIPLDSLSKEKKKEKIQQLLKLPIQTAEKTPTTIEFTAALTVFHTFGNATIGKENPIPSVDDLNNMLTETFSELLLDFVDDLKSDKPDEEVIKLIIDKMKNMVNKVASGITNPMDSIKHEMISILIEPLLEELKTKFAVKKPDISEIKKLLSDKLDSDPKLGTLIEKAKQASELAKKTGLSVFDVNTEIENVKTLIAEKIVGQLATIDIQKLNADDLIKMLIEQPDSASETDNKPSEPSSETDNKPSEPSSETDNKPSEPSSETDNKPNTDTDSNDALKKEEAEKKAAEEAEAKEKAEEIKVVEEQLVSLPPDKLTDRLNKGCGEDRIISLIKIADNFNEDDEKICPENMVNNAAAAAAAGGSRKKRRRTKKYRKKNNKKSVKKSKKKSHKK